MESPAQIQAAHRNGNLHVNLEGHFGPATAGELTHAIAQTYQGKGNIFIHTKGITSVAPEAGTAFTTSLVLSGLPHEKVYLTGRKGLDISPDKGKVIVYEKKKTGCCGRCRGCKCTDRN